MTDLIFLTGMSRAGKTVIGQALAKKLKKVFFDTDSELEKNCKCKIPILYLKQGEKKFRKEEFKIFHNIILATQNAVISTGGGFADNPEALHLLKNYKQIILLDTDPLIIFERIKKEADKNLYYPAFLGSGIKGEEDAKKIFFQIYERRIEIYKKISSLTVKPQKTGIEQTVNLILQNINAGL